LEERATPASLLAPIDAPEVAAVADLAPNPTTFEEADQPIVRLDLMPAGSSLKSDAGQEGEDALAQSDGSDALFATKRCETETEEAAPTADIDTQELLALEFEWLAMHDGYTV